MPVSRPLTCQFFAQLGPYTMTANGDAKYRFLIFGRTGWIGGLLGDLLKQQGETFDFANARLEDRASVVAEIERVRYGVAALSAGSPRVSRSNTLQPFSTCRAACALAVQAHTCSQRSRPDRQAQRGLV